MVRIIFGLLALIFLLSNMLALFYSVLSNPTSGGSASVAFNPLTTGANVTLSSLNTIATENSSGGMTSILANACSGSLKQYVEFKVLGIGSGSSGDPYIGLVNGISSSYFNAAIGAYSDYVKFTLGGSGTAGVGSTSKTNHAVNFARTFSNGDIVMYAMDIANGNIWVGVNGTWGTASGGLGVPATATNPSFTGVTSGTWYPAATPYAASQSLQVQGSGPGWSYTPPVGFNALDGSQYANTAIYWDNGACYQALTLSSYQLVVSQVGGGHSPVITSLSASSGKRYIEFTFVSFSGSGEAFFGFANSNSSAIYSVNAYLGSSSFGSVTSAAYNSVSQVYQNGYTSMAGSGNLGNMINGDKVMMAIDYTLGYAWFGKNGTWLTNSLGVGNPAGGTNPGISGISGSTWPACSIYNTASASVQGSASQWTYTRPTGFLGYDGS